MLSSCNIYYGKLNVADLKSMKSEVVTLKQIANVQPLKGSESIRISVCLNSLRKY